MAAGFRGLWEAVFGWLASPPAPAVYQPPMYEIDVGVEDRFIDVGEEARFIDVPVEDRFIDVGDT